MERGILESMERQFWLAGIEFYEQSLAPDAVMVFPGPAGVMTRSRILTGLSEAPRWTRVLMERVRFIELGPDAVIMTYAARGEREGSPPYDVLASSVYARRDGTWQLVFHQQTPALAAG